jgi:hypothetical protein
MNYVERVARIRAGKHGQPQPKNVIYANKRTNGLNWQSELNVSRLVSSMRKWFPDYSVEIHRGKPRPKAILRVRFACRSRSWTRRHCESAVVVCDDQNRVTIWWGVQEGQYATDRGAVRVCIGKDFMPMVDDRSSHSRQLCLKDAVIRMHYALWEEREKKSKKRKMRPHLERPTECPEPPAETLCG